MKIGKVALAAALCLAGSAWAVSPLVDGLVAYWDFATNALTLRLSVQPNPTLDPAAWTKLPLAGASHSVVGNHLSLSVPPSPSVRFFRWRAEAASL